MDLFNLRRDFSLKTLNEKDVLTNPIAMLQQWLDEAMQAQALEPSAMTVSTVSKDGKPSSRVVLIKEIKHEGLVFFSNYESKKGMQIEENNNCAINFMWHELERQVRIEGIIEKVSGEDSDKYYNMRPLESRIGAWASPQSQVIPNREYLDERVAEYQKQFESAAIHRPTHWGGYIIRPTLFEFWQGRKSRLHDRIQYTQTKNSWDIERLAP